MTWAIGDVQGCMASLERLLDTIGWRREPLWLAGDLVNRGPRSLDVLRWARANERFVTVVLGNHDVHLLGRAAGAAKPKKRDTLDEALGAPELIAWLGRQPLLAGDRDHLLVHAGVLPGWSRADIERRARAAERQLPDLIRGGGDPEARETLEALTKLRCCTPDGEIVAEFDGPPADAPKGTRPWWDFLAPDLPVVVHGHWASAGFLLEARHIALDSGCVWGGKLTAVRLEDRRVVQVSPAE